MPDPARADARHWVSFRDDDGDTWLFDLTFLTSGWSCTFGRGCPGTSNDEAAQHQGCCSHGAHLFDDDDKNHVVAMAERLTDEDWQFRGQVHEADDLFQAGEDGLLTKTVDGGCIFLNRPDFATGAGCALHFGAVRAEETPADWKPVVCWQLPLRLEETKDEAGRSTFMVRAWDRGDWGGGGTDFTWWCTDELPGGSPPVYLSLRDELVKLVGEWPYAQLRSFAESGATSVSLSPR